MKFKLFPCLILILILVACGQPPREKALRILQEGLNDSNIVIRLNAARGLMETGDAKGLQIIYTVLKGNDDEGTVAALGVLNDLGENTLSPALISLSSKDNPLIRTEVFRLIARIPDTAGRLILKEGTHDKIGKVRRFAYSGLEKYRDRTLIMTGLRDVDPMVRITCAAILNRIGEEKMGNFIKREMNNIKTQDLWIEGCRLLGEIDDDTATVSFLKGLLTDVPWDMRLAAAEGLLLLRQPEAVGVVREGFMSSDPFIRARSVEVANRFNRPEFYESLAKMADDMYINVSIMAVRTMARYRRPENVGTFIRLMDAPSPLVRIAAASALLQSK